MRILESHFPFDFCHWKAKQITFGKAQTLCEWLNNWHQLCFSWEQIGHTGYITVWQENPFLDNFTHLHFNRFSFEIFALKSLCSQLSSHLHSQPFSRNWPTPRKQRKTEAMTFIFPCENMEKQMKEHISSFLFLLSKKKKAQLVCVQHQPMVPHSSSPSCTSQSSCSRTPWFSPTHMSLQKGSN